MTDENIRFQSIAELEKLLEARLKKEKPGLKSQLKMCPDPPPSTMTVNEAGDNCQKAGVLILLYPKDGTIHLVFIERTATVSHHQNQISFPGGHKNDNENVIEAALRESWEELKIPASKLRILGELTPLYVQTSNYCINPVVAVSDRRPDFKPCSGEVARVIEVPLNHLMNSDSQHTETWWLRGRKVKVPFYLYQDNKIWGATAMVLSELLDILSSV
jgi:8-oxo-dGTP pyrophosphatase MutT (NUDIX family)